MLLGVDFFRLDPMILPYGSLPLRMGQGGADRRVLDNPLGLQSKKIVCQN